MIKFITTILFVFILMQTFGQSPKKLSVYLQTQFNLTIYDRTAGNNPWGIGMGTQVFLNNKTKFKPVIEFTADTYISDDKVARLNPDGKIAEDLGNMFNLFGGASFHASQKLYLSIIAGPSFINGQTLFGVKPSFGLYSSHQKWTGRVSFINVFNRDKTTKEDFGTLSFTIGRKIF
ncbi:MAG TPA: hypothetical protein VH396_02845 [Chitinophagaceae bacterium]